MLLNWPRIEMSRVEEEEPLLWRVGGSIAYGGALWQSQMDVHSTGMVRMTNDETIATDLPLSLIRQRNGVRRLE